MKICRKYVKQKNLLHAQTVLPRVEWPPAHEFYLHNDLSWGDPHCQWLVMARSSHEVQLRYSSAFLAMCCRSESASLSSCDTSASFSSLLLSSRWILSSSSVSNSDTNTWTRAVRPQPCGTQKHPCKGNKYA